MPHMTVNTPFAISFVVVMNAEKYMKRCLDIARLGLGRVAPNPMVGAVLIYENKIIGEGYHELFGGPHAEVNAINDALGKGNKELIRRSTLYVCLEPCLHYGKTPPCSELIIHHEIPKVVIGCRDPYPEVNGKGIAKLKAAGIEVVEGILEEECKELNKRFIVFQKQHRPFVILKWAETRDNYLAPLDPAKGAKERLFISNEYTHRLVHKWRSEESSILVGTNTALSDDPLLTARLWKGKNPTRLVIDMKLKLPGSLNIFNKAARTIIFNTLKHEEEDDLFFYRVREEVSLVRQISNALYQLKIQSVIVEGGARLLQSLIDEGLWDEARVIRNKELVIREGLKAPLLREVEQKRQQIVGSDEFILYEHIR